MNQIEDYLHNCTFSSTSILIQIFSNKYDIIQSVPVTDLSNSSSDAIYYPNDTQLTLTLRFFIVCPKGCIKTCLYIVDSHNIFEIIYRTKNKQIAAKNTKKWAKNTKEKEMGESQLPERAMDGPKICFQAGCCQSVVLLQAEPLERLYFLLLYIVYRIYSNRKYIIRMIHSDKRYIILMICSKIYYTIPMVYSAGGKLLISVTVNDCIRSALNSAKTMNPIKKGILSN